MPSCLQGRYLWVSTIGTGSMGPLTLGYPTYRSYMQVNNLIVFRPEISKIYLSVVQRTFSIVYNVGPGLSGVQRALSGVQRTFAKYALLSGVQLTSLVAYSGHSQGQKIYPILVAYSGRLVAYSGRLVAYSGLQPSCPLYATKRPLYATKSRTNVRYTLLNKCPLYATKRALYATKRPLYATKDFKKSGPQPETGIIGEFDGNRTLAIFYWESENSFFLLINFLLNNFIQSCPISEILIYCHLLTISTLVRSEVPWYWPSPTKMRIN